MAMRAQVSLQFSDVNLYNNFIVPYKENRALNSLIVKCLTSYYYDEKVRDLIDGTTEIKQSGEQATHSICDGIRASLMMQDFFASELNTVIKNGTEDVENILDQANDIAKKSGVVKSTQSEYDSEILQIVTDSESSEVTSDSVCDKVTFDTLVKAVLELARASGNTEVACMLNPVESEETPDDIKTSIESDTVEVDMTPEDITEVYKEPVSDTPIAVEVEEDFVVEPSKDFSVEEVVPVTNDFEEDSDASDAMKELLGSLF